MKASAGTDLSFEAALTQLQTVVDRLEGGELDLEDAVAAFEEGARLTRRCAEALSAAEQRIEVLSRQGDDWKVAPFELEDDAESEEDDEGAGDDPEPWNDGVGD